MKRKVSTSTGKVVLGVIWYVMGGVLFVVFFVQTLFGKYETATEDAWSWFLPTVMPTLTLITGILVADATRRDRRRSSVGLFLFVSSIVLSVVYLSAVGLVVFLIPFLAEQPMEVMKRSNLGLAPLQGIVAAMIGVFFMQRTIEK